jgi:cytochrome c biogenesis protein CcdA
MHDLVSSVRTLLESGGYGPLSLVFSFIVGILSAIASACCTLPIIGALAGYSVIRKEDRSSVLRSGLLFMAGSIVTLMAIGSIVIFTGQTIRGISGDYWKIAAGCAALLFGIGALELFPFKMPKIKLLPAQSTSAGLWPGIAGIVFGGAIAVSSLPCNPGIFIILGAAVLQQHTFWAIITLASYAIGFSVPLTLLVFGLSLGKSLINFQKMEKIVRIIAGIALVAVGIYFFSSI